MSGVLAARIGDEVGHSGASIGAWIGAAAGLILAGAIVAVTGGAALVVIGALVAGGAGGALAGIHIGEAALPTCSALTTGSHNVKIEQMWAARADQDIDAHNSNLIAQGSLRVLVNKKNLARLHDKVCCGGKIKTSARKTVVGEDTATHYQVTDPGEVSEGTKTALTWAMWIGVGMVTAGTGLAYYAAGHSVVASTTAAVAVNGVPMVVGMGAGAGSGYVAREMGADEVTARSIEVGVGTVFGLGAGLGAGKFMGSPRGQAMMGEPTAPRAFTNPVARAAMAEMNPLIRLPSRGGAAGAGGDEAPPGGRPPGDGDAPTQAVESIELPGYTRTAGEQLTFDPNVKTGTRMNQWGRQETTILADGAPEWFPARITRELSPAAELTGGRGERFMVRRAGFPSKQEYNGMAQDAVEAAGARVRNGEVRTLDELMTDLAARRGEIARQMGDPDAAQFGVRRVSTETGDAYTPFVDRYAYAYGRAQQAGRVTAELEGVPVQMTEPSAIPGSAAWHHTPPENIPPIMRHAETLYARAMDPATPPGDVPAIVAELHYYLAHAMPFNRGSAAVTDMVTKTIFDARGISTSPTRNGVVVDIEALVTPTAREFVARYGDMFEVPPGGGRSGAAGENPTLALEQYTRAPGENLTRTQAPERTAPPPNPPEPAPEATGGEPPPPKPTTADADPAVDLPTVTREPGQNVVTTAVPKAALEIIKDVGSLQGRSVAEIRTLLTEQGYTQHPASNGGEIWVKPGNDGKRAIVRLDPGDLSLPAEKPAGRVPHAHKEIVNDNHWLGTDYKPGKQKVYADDGTQITKGDPNGATKAHIPIDAPGWETP